MTPIRADVFAEKPTLTQGIKSQSQTITFLSAVGPSSSAGVSRDLITGYEIEGELGRGGMGIVYKARQVGLNRLVAIKMILGGQHASSEMLARFREEARAIAALQHPNIVQVHEVGLHEGLPYLSLEYVDGGSLDRRLSGNPFAPRDAAQLIRTLSEAIHAVHQRGIIHLDLKPANILLGADGTPKITDFGLAKSIADDRGRTATGAVLGTPSYMAPEQAGGRRREIGPAADIYALGAILYELLTGQPPFRAETPLDTLLLLVTEEVAPPRELQPGVPRALEAICLKCLRKEPDQRYAAAGDLAADLRRYLDGEPVKARRMTSGERAARWLTQHPGTFLLLALTGILIWVSLALLGGADDPIWGAAILGPCAIVLMHLLPGIRGAIMAFFFSILLCCVILAALLPLPDKLIPLLSVCVGAAIGGAAGRGLAWLFAGDRIVTVLAGFWSAILAFGLSLLLLAVSLGDRGANLILVLILSFGISLLVFVVASFCAAIFTRRRNLTH